PVVAEGRVYLTTAVVEDETVSLQVRCHRLDNGTPLWEREVFRSASDHLYQKNTCASPTPIFADGRLYAHFGHKGTACLSADDGSVLWTQTSLDYDPVHSSAVRPLSSTTSSFSPTTDGKT